MCTTPLSFFFPSFFLFLPLAISHNPIRQVPLCPFSSFLSSVISSGNLFRFVLCLVFDVHPPQKNNSFSQTAIHLRSYIGDRAEMDTFGCVCFYWGDQECLFVLHVVERVPHLRVRVCNLFELRVSYKEKNVVKNANVMSVKRWLIGLLLLLLFVCSFRSFLYVCCSHGLMMLVVCRSGVCNSPLPFSFLELISMTLCSSFA